MEVLERFSFSRVAGGLGQVIILAQPVYTTVPVCAYVHVLVLCVCVIVRHPHPPAPASQVTITSAIQVRKTGTTDVMRQTIAPDLPFAAVW